MKKVILTMVFAFVTIVTFAQDLQMVKNKKGKVGYNEGKKKVIEAKYDDGGNFDKQTGLARVQLNGKWGFIDKTGKEIIPLEYDEVGNSYTVKGITAMKVKKGGWGFIDMTGKVLVPLKYTALNAAPYEPDDVFFAVDGKKWGIITIAGKVLVEPAYSLITQTGVKPAVYQGKMGSETHVFSETGELISTNGNAFKKTSPTKAVNWKCSQCGEVKSSVDRPVSGSGGCNHLDKNGAKQNGSHKWEQQ